MSNNTITPDELFKSWDEQVAKWKLLETRHSQATKELGDFSYQLNRFCNDHAATLLEHVLSIGDVNVETDLDLPSLKLKSEAINDFSLSSSFSTSVYSFDYKIPHFSGQHCVTTPVLKITPVYTSGGNAPPYTTLYVKVKESLDYAEDALALVDFITERVPSRYDVCHALFARSHEYKRVNCSRKELENELEQILKEIEEQTCPANELNEFVSKHADILRTLFE